MVRTTLRFILAALVVQFYPTVSEAQQLTVGTFLQNTVLQYPGPTGPAPGTVIASAGDGAFGISGLAQRPGDPSVFFSAQFSEAIFKYTPGVGVSPVILPTTLQPIANPGNPTGTNSYGPSGLAFGSDGLLYVARSGGFASPSAGTGAVDRFDVNTGSFVNSIATGLTATVGVTISGNDLYISNRLSSLVPPNLAPGNVVKISNYATTPVQSTLIPALSSSALFPTNTAMGPDNLLYVADVGDELGNLGGGPIPGGITRFNPVTGAQDLTFSMVLPGKSPSGLTFTPDGKLLVANLGTAFSAPYNGSVELWDVTTGPTPMLLQTIDTGLMASTVLVAVPEPALLLVLGGLAFLGLRRKM